MKVTFIMLLLFAIFLHPYDAQSPGSREDKTIVIEPHPGEYEYGRWGTWQICEKGYYVTNFRILVKEPNAKDNTTMEGIQLGCRSLAGTFSNNITTQYSYKTTALWGSNESVEGEDFFTDAKVKYEAEKSWYNPGDDTAVNSIIMRSAKGVEKEPDNPGPFGKWSAFKSCPFGDAICGVRASYDKIWNRYDKTGVVALNFQCCNLLKFEYLSMDFDDVDLSGISLKPQILDTQIVNNPSDAVVVKSIIIGQPKITNYTYAFSQTLTNFSTVEVEADMPILHAILSSSPLEANIKTGHNITISKTVGMPIVQAVESSILLEANVEEGVIITKPTNFSHQIGQEIQVQPNTCIRTTAIIDVSDEDVQFPFVAKFKVSPGSGNIDMTRDEGIVKGVLLQGGFNGETINQIEDYWIVSIKGVLTTGLAVNMRLAHENFPSSDPECDK